MLARRVNRPDGSFGGIVYGSINLEKLGAHFASLSIGPEGIIELRDPDLALIVGHGGSWVTPGERVASPDGTERIDVFTRLVPYGQHLRVGLGTREVFEPWRRELRQTLGFVAVFLLLVGASAGMAFSAWLRHQRDAERIRSREALLAEANSRLLELNHQKDQFLRLVVHDLRNPLSGIIMAAEVLEGERDIAQVGGVARNIFLEGMEMTSLIARFLDIAKIDSGDIKAKPESFDLAALAHRIADCHEARSRRKGITFNFQLPPGGAATYADPAYAREVLDNLVSNAIKFSPAGTTVTMRIEVGPEEVVLSVEDQGPGLTEEDRAKLFSRFVTLSAKPTGGEKSTGLGLNIVKHMVEAMAGRIWVDSMLAKGAAFRVALPKAPD